MTCLVCGWQMSTQRENYQYTASGLPYVTLHQVEVSRCPNCGETEVAIPQIEDLHQAIAATVIRKPARLAPQEIRYLRKYLGWSGSDFAERMGVAPETVSRWETGKEPLGKVADRLLRLMVVNEVPVQDYSTESLKQISGESEAPALRMSLSVEREHWLAEALAPA